MYLGIMAGWPDTADRVGYSGGTSSRCGGMCISRQFFLPFNGDPELHRR